jgi:hypothetical protein
MPSKLPKALSEGEETFALHCTIYKLSPEREYLFAKEEGRKWRFDFAWPEQKVAAEINGGTWTNGRHNRGSSMSKEYEKLNHAALGGWRVFQFTTETVQSGSAIDMIVTALG